MLKNYFLLSIRNILKQRGYAIVNTMGLAIGLAAAIFAPVMNITGSSLALWWRNKPVPEETSFDTEEVVHHV